MVAHLSHTHTHITQTRYIFFPPETPNGSPPVVNDGYFFCGHDFILYYRKIASHLFPPVRSVIFVQVEMAIHW